MKIETYLNAMERARYRAAQLKRYNNKYDRQYRAFRARILSGDEGKKDNAIAEKDEKMRQLQVTVDELIDQIHLLKY